MYVRASITQAAVPNAILVPQAGVTRMPARYGDGAAGRPDDKAVLREVTTDRTIGDKWLVTKGLSPGDKVIVEGLGKIKVGQKIVPVVAGSKPRARPAGEAGNATGAMISRIFIDRPIFAWVLAIIVMMGGIGGILSLPIEQYPDIAPTSVNVRATYPGASADALEASVTQVIEQQLTGIDGLIYFSASSSSSGSATITATFRKGVDPDIAQVQVQNKVQQALSRLPQQVQQQGLTVTKSNPDFLLIVAVYDESGRSDPIDVGDYLVSNLQDAIGRTQGLATSTCSARNMRCGSGSIRSSSRRCSSIRAMSSPPSRRRIRKSRLGRSAPSLQVPNRCSMRRSLQDRG